VKIARAIDRLWTQQITVQGMLVNFPVQPDFIVANPSQMIPLKKVLGTLMTVEATGVGSPGSPFGDRTQLAGNNVFAGILPIQIFSPIMPTAQAIIGKSKRGTVTLRKSDFAVEEQNAFSFDATMLKASERFMPAVIEDRFLCDVVFTG